MEKFTANFPRSVIETRFPFELSERDWLISISDAAGWAPTPKNKFDRVFEFFFDDAMPPWDGVMQSEQAAEMAEVINLARNFDKNVWVHCTAGMCRSGAVVEVLGLLGWTITDEFSPKRLPNSHVFTTLRQHFPEIEQSWDKVIEEKGYNFYYDWVATQTDPEKE